jgi:hypothetical protein
VESTFGQGRTLMLGSYVSAGFISRPEETTRRFYAALLDWAGVSRPVAVAGDPLEVRLVESGDDGLVFVFNHGAEPATSTLSLRWPEGEARVTDLVTGEEVEMPRRASGLEWRGTLAGRDVLVFRVAPR